MKLLKTITFSTLSFMYSIAVSQYASTLNISDFKYSINCAKKNGGGECKLIISKNNPLMIDFATFVFLNTDRVICSIITPYTANTNGSLICITAKDYPQNGSAGTNVGCAAWSISNGIKSIAPMKLDDLKKISEQPSYIYAPFYQEFNNRTTANKQEFTCVGRVVEFSPHLFWNIAPIKATKNKPAV